MRGRRPQTACTKKSGAATTLPRKSASTQNALSETVSELRASQEVERDHADEVGYRQEGQGRDGRERPPRAGLWSASCTRQEKEVAETCMDRQCC